MRSPFSRSATRRSWNVCNPSQNSTLAPLHRAKRRAISGETLRLPRTRRLTVMGATPSALATAQDESPSGTIKSSRSTSPGCGIASKLSADLDFIAVLMVVGDALTPNCGIVQWSAFARRCGVLEELAKSCPLQGRRPVGLWGVAIFNEPGVFCEGPRALACRRAAWRLWRALEAPALRRRDQRFHSRS